VQDGTTIAEKLSPDNPFGWPPAEYLRVRTEEAQSLQPALATFCSGRTNRLGGLFPEPVDWEQNVNTSAEWTDLSLEIRVLQELGAQPLVWSLPLPGVFDDYTPISAPARQTYYQRYRNLQAQYPSVSSIDFSQFDEDRFFLTDTSAHLSPRGWLIADRLLDMHWHGRSREEMQAAVDQLNQSVPSTGPPPPAPVYCASVVQAAA